MKRNAKRYPFIIGNHFKNKAFCCIDRRKIENKNDLIYVFSAFLEELNKKSSLIIHLKPNCVLQENSTIPKQILDLTEECKLEVEEYEKILSSKKFNIVVKPRFYLSKEKKSQKQLEYTNFLLKLLMLKEEEKQITPD